MRNGGGRLLAILGILLLIVAAVVYFLFFLTPPNTAQQTDVQAMPTSEPTRRVVVARIDIPDNTVLSDVETYLQLGEIREADYNAQPSNYFDSMSELRNKIALVGVSAGQPILSSDVIEGGLSLRIPEAAEDEARPKAYPMQVGNQTGVADQISEGDRVDVIFTFRFSLTFLRPGVDEAGNLTIKEEIREDLFSTKTIIQNVEVLHISRPAAEVSEEDQAAAEEMVDENGQPIVPADSGNILRAGEWFIIVALTDQQAEVMELARIQDAAVTLVLRGRGDTAIETTNGVTIRSLISDFGLPMPELFEVQNETEEDEETPQPSTQETPEPSP
jgi:pilus assembly protein CpaB